MDKENNLKAVRMLAVLLTIFAVVGCTSTDTKCNINEDTSMITAKVGEEFTITLDSNPTTGYSWKLPEKFSEGIIKLVNHEFQPPETQRKGAGGKEIWRFKAVTAGKTTITLDYVRLWEKDKEPAKKSTFEITVK